MKLKQQPEDFQVEELTDVTPAAEGGFAFYRLEKRGLTTPDALATMRRRWRIEPRRISFGGLKDRHALTVQYLSIYHGPKRHIRQDDLKVDYLGQVTGPFVSSAIVANRFQITLRAMNADAIARARSALEEIRLQGIPNYFDDQRFGSVSAGGQFIARLLVLGRFEEALRLALVGPYEHDRAEQKKEKALLRSNWGNWTALKQSLSRGRTQSIVNFLSHRPDDFRGAFLRLDPELRFLYMSAYQSHLWNRILARWLQRNCNGEQLGTISLRLGDYPVHRSLTPEHLEKLKELSLPLPSARAKLESNDSRQSIVAEVLAEEELEIRQLQVKGVRELFFSKGEREALCMPTDLELEADADELNQGLQKMTLGFQLPRGCYATLIVKRITAMRAR